MTETPLRADSSPAPARSRHASPVRRPKRHPLIGAFPLAVMTLATFLVVFTILMARLQSGVDPALGPAANRSLIAPGRSGGAVVTRASGSAAPAVVKSGSPSVSTSPVLTRTSGSRDGESDDA